MPLGKQTRPAALARPALLAAALGASLFLLGIAWLTARVRPGALRPVRAVGVAVGISWLYTAVLTVVSVTWNLPSVRYQLLLLLPTAVTALWVTERLRPGAFLDIIYRSSVLQLTLTAFYGQSEYDRYVTGRDRLVGGTSSVFLAFLAEATLLAAFLSWRTSTGSKRLVPALYVAPLCVYTLFAAFSRTAFIGITTAALVLLVLSNRKYRPFVGVVVAFAAFLGLVVGLQAAINYLSGGSDAFATGSGRYAIWRRLLSNNDHWWRGYGFAALRDVNGPDAGLYILNRGAPAESSPLNALLMGGWAALVLWLLLAGTMLRTAWVSRQTTAGISAALAVPLTLHAIFGVGMSGVSVDFWWFLAIFSLVNRCAKERDGAADGHDEAPPRGLRAERGRSGRAR